MISGRHRSALVPVPSSPSFPEVSCSWGPLQITSMGAPKFGKLVLKVIAATNTITSIAAGEMDGFYQAPTDWTMPWQPRIWGLL